MELEKLLKLREVLNQEEKKIFDKAYDSLKDLFLSHIDLVTKALKDGVMVENSLKFDTGFKAARVINKLGTKYDVKISIPESDNYLLSMYLLKFGTDVLKHKKGEEKTQPKES